MKIQPHHLDGLAALAAASQEKLRKQKGEKDTAFVKRIVCAYMNAHHAMETERQRLATAGGNLIVRAGEQG